MTTTSIQGSSTTTAAVTVSQELPAEELVTAQASAPTGATYRTAGGLEVLIGVPDPEGLSPAQQIAADFDLRCDRLPDTPIIDLLPTDDFATTEMLDVRSEQKRTIDEIIDGSRPVLFWFWQPCGEGTGLRYAEFTAFAAENSDLFQAIGIGAAGDYVGVPLLQSPNDDAVTMLWDDDHAWGLFDGPPIASAMLFTHDFSGQSAPFFLNDGGREVVLGAAPQSPWSPVDE